jgi:hypothetical protein
VNCKHCDKPISFKYLHADKLRKYNECFRCNHFMALARAAKHERERYFVAVWHDGKPHHFSIGAENAPISFRGFGGHHYRIHFHDGRVTETMNLWHQGEIPAHLARHLPVNAELIDAEQPAVSTG